MNNEIKELKELKAQLKLESARADLAENSLSNAIKRIKDLEAKKRSY